MKPLELTNLETADLCRQLALLMHSGVSAGDGLNLLAEGEADANVKALLEEMTAAADAGAYLHQIFEAAGCFDAYVTGLLQVGEQVGRTEETLHALADHYEEKERTERQLVSSLTYPAIVLVMMAVVIIVLLSQVLPIFNDIYASLGGRLTGLGGALLALGRLLDRAIPALCALLVAGLCAVLALALSRKLRKKALSRILQRWGDRGIWRRMNNARFAQALAMGYASGMPLEEAAELAALLLRDVPTAAQRCQACIALLRQGESLDRALEAGDLMTPAARRMLTLGLRSGAGDRVLADIARRMQEEARGALERIVARVEPALVLLTSVLVGVILLSVMLPLMNIMTTIG